MGAVALSRNDEEVLENLQETLHIPSKAQVIHRALQVLEQSVARERLANEIRQSVLRCGRFDRKEHARLTGAAFHRLEKE